MADVTQLAYHRANDVDALITRATKALIAAYDSSPYVVADRLGISYETLNRRLKGSSKGGWPARDVKGIAEMFNQDLDALLAGRPDLTLPTPPGTGGRPSTLGDAPSARSSTDRASDYGSEVRRSGGAKAIRPAA